MEIDCVEFNLFEPQAMISPKNPETVISNSQLNSSPMQDFAHDIAENRINANIILPQMQKQQENLSARETYTNLKNFEDNENPGEVLRSEDTQTLITEFLNDKIC